MPTPRQRPLSPGVSTSLDSVHITPRTPRSARPIHADDSAEAGDFVGGGASAEEVEMSLLGEDERRRARHGFAEGDGHLHVTHKAPLSPEDKRAMVLLCVLCTSPFSYSLVGQLYHRPCSQT
jgi:MFS transporter, PAT family, solute carrier family 33 (acetyl-CoA transportor), member 1